MRPGRGARRLGRGSPTSRARLGAAGAPVYAGGDDVRRVVSGLGMPQSIIALFHRPARPDVADLAARCRRIVVLEAVDNPANVGAIIRNAAGLGWDGLILDHTSADPLARRSLRVAMGTAFALPHARTTIAHRRHRRLRGVNLFAMTPDRDAVGARDGRPRRPRRGSDRLRAIRIVRRAARTRHARADPDGAHGVDSLNAAAATAIACWELRIRG